MAVLTRLAHHRHTMKNPAPPASYPQSAPQPEPPATNDLRAFIVIAVLIIVGMTWQYSQSNPVSTPIVREETVVMEQVQRLAQETRAQWVRATIKDMTPAEAATRLSRQTDDEQVGSVTYTVDERGMVTVRADDYDLWLRVTPTGRGGETTCTGAPEAYLPEGCTLAD